MILFFRLLPFLVGALEVVVFREQMVHPLSYPGIVLIGVIALPLSAFLMSWRRVHLGDMMEKMTPAFILLASLAFSLLLIEGEVALWIVACIASLASYFSLEMLFLHAYVPTRYPVHGLSRLHIAYVPIIIWYASATSTGLLTFVHSDRVIHLAGMTALGMILFRTTGHPGATKEANRIWMFVGALAGLHVGLLGLFLPLRMPAQGMLAAIILSALLRVRRYLYEPKPSRRQAWIEGVSVAIILVAVATTSAWI
ncbi:MAG: hypothetical protein NUV81_00660 [bacterium]|nr:hypothetical protein [bacterium]